MQVILKQLIAPCGLVWIGLIITTVLSWRSRKRILLACNLALLVGYTLLGNVWIGQTMMSWLDSRYAAVDSLSAGPFDAVCVLGGATFTSPHGRAQVGVAGDRVMLGARLYSTGRTPLLACTGRSETGRDPADECAEIWRDLGIPAEDIIQVGGRDTIEEIEQLRLAIQERGWKRVGIVTSSWHMRRAMDCAVASGVELEPLPSGLSGKWPEWSFQGHTIPQAKGFVLSQFATKEMLGTALQ